MNRKFQRKIEDFVCENCGEKTKGNGYTDHCPRCLYSKHVDIHPGDRECDCNGLMEPIGAEIKHGEYIVLYQCKKCNYQHHVKVDKNDSFEVILKLFSDY